MDEVIHLQHDIAWCCRDSYEARCAEKLSPDVIAELLSMTDQLDLVLRRLRAAAEMVTCPQGCEVLLGTFCNARDVLVDTREKLYAAQTRDETRRIIFRVGTGGRSAHP